MKQLLAKCIDKIFINLKENGVIDLSKEVGKLSRTERRRRAYKKLGKAAPNSVLPANLYQQK